MLLETILVDCIDNNNSLKVQRYSIQYYRTSIKTFSSRLLIGKQCSTNESANKCKQLEYVRFATTKASKRFLMQGIL